MVDARKGLRGVRPLFPVFENSIGKQGTELLCTGGHISLLDWRVGQVFSWSKVFLQKQSRPSPDWRLGQFFLLTEGVYAAPLEVNDDNMKTQNRGILRPICFVLN